MFALLKNKENYITLLHLSFKVSVRQLMCHIVKIKSGSDGSWNYTQSIPNPQVSLNNMVQQICAYNYCVKKIDLQLAYQV